MQLFSFLHLPYIREIIVNNSNLEQLCPDILITDIKMPVMDGLELIKKVHENHPYIDYIIVTGYSDFSYAKKAIHYQVREYLLKPIEDELLYETLSELRNEFITRTHDYSQIFNDEVSSHPSPDIPYILKNYILNHYKEDIKLNAIASTMHYSSSYLTKIFNQEYDCSPSKYLISVQIQNAQQCGIPEKTDRWRLCDLCHIKVFDCKYLYLFLNNYRPFSI